MELVNKKLLIFEHYQMDVENIVSIVMVGKDDNMSTIGFCAKKILGIVGSQIETKIILPLDGIFISFRKCCLQLEMFWLPISP
jgi:hypothetical protein